MMRAMFLLLALVACSHPVPVPDALPEPPIPAVEPPPPPAAVAVPKKIRAALDRAVPREQALAASPASDGADIALVRKLHRNVVTALAELERDGGRHVTPAAIARAQTAVKDLQNHLDEFQAEQKDSP
jgi:hypothetical protein